LLLLHKHDAPDHMITMERIFLLPMPPGSCDNSLEPGGLNAVSRMQVLPEVRRMRAFQNRARPFIEPALQRKVLSHTFAIHDIRIP